MNKKVNLICPTCKTANALEVPIEVIEESRQLTTVSIPSGLICSHSFQAFIDKNFVVRGYQKIHYDFAETQFFNEKTPQTYNVTTLGNAKTLVLSFFHSIKGPSLFLTAGEPIEESKLKHIPDLLNIYELGFFVHIFENIKTANYSFEIPNVEGRGGSETILASIIFSEGDMNLELAEELLKIFANEVIKIEDAYKGFYVDSKKYTGCEESFKEIKQIFEEFHASFPDENIIEYRKDAKIFVYGPSKAGKTTIIKCLQDKDPSQTVPTTNISISRIFVNNVSILTYDVPGQSKFRDLWAKYLKNQNGLVFIMDASEKAKYTEACETLHNIANQPQMKDLPILVLFNKVDIERPDIELLLDAMDISQLDNRPCKYYLTSGRTKEGLNEAFNWFSQQLSIALRVPDRLLIQTKVEGGLIFSKWDEDLGLELIAVHPQEAFTDPEIIAIRCFSILQTVFGGEEFSKTISFILPFPNLSAKAAIYFDYVEDSSIRGGKLPLSIVCFYDEKVEKETIESLHDLIINEFATIKHDHMVAEKVQGALKGIFKKIETTLKQIESSGVSKEKEIVHPVTIKEEKEHCIICNNNIEKLEESYTSPLIFGHICKTCQTNYDDEELDVMSSMFFAYGGYLGMEKKIEISTHEDIKKLKDEIKTSENEQPKSVKYARFLHKALIQGLSINEFNKEIKPLIKR